ncbi:5-oxoprolinase subunit PxpA [Agarivorans sp. Z349TD_8]|uniref:5-oxoprolinase subunit PxpA n=1 Tax=Agarivorans sp. Z349TD_8 TaxID=3421434 RepID=UPI003D7CD585
MRLNCDMGESYGVWKMGADELAMPFIDMANIACGGHASDPHVMSQTIALAKQHQVQIGAHPSYADIAGFGRRTIAYQPEQLSQIILAQIGGLQALCRYQATQIHYVKPHGALYNDMHCSAQIFEAVLKAVASLEGEIKLMVSASLSTGFVSRLAEQYQVGLIKEAFCDRRYLANGQLQSRELDGAVLSQPNDLLAQVNLLQQQQVICSDGSRLNISADTLCVHGDNAAAVAQIKLIKQILDPQTKSL